MIAIIGNKMKRFFFVFCQLLLIPEILVFTTVSFAIVTHTEAARASDQVADYATSREWLTLLHAEHHLSGFRSHVDGSGFFRASDGSINPTHELVTDLIELQNPASLLDSRFHNLIVPSCYKTPSRTVLVVFPHTAPRSEFTLISIQTVGL